MVWIPGGALVAGTPKEQLPRKADQEMPGEQLILEGFLVDQFAFPNEPGAIPITNVTQEEARALCEEKGKRLCSELEWERACKGPRNLTYEYGNRYQEASCGTGGPPRTLPSGYLFGCRSEFGVHDLHGSLWEWTDSFWGRATDGDELALRGGTDTEGRVVGRCANAKPAPQGSRDPTVGFRCCQGQRNTAEVTIGVNKGQALRRVLRPDRDLMSTLEKSMPEDIQTKMKQRGVFRVASLWEWKPVANEDLLLATGCAGIPPLRSCGALIVRRTLGRLDVLDWADSGHFVPLVRMEYSPLKVWVYGGDKLSHYRRDVHFDWGDVRVGEIVRTARAPAPSRSSKTQAGPRVDQANAAARARFGRSGAKGRRPVQREQNEGAPDPPTAP
jgi:hypothetical protein